MRETSRLILGMPCATGIRLEDDQGSGGKPVPERGVIVWLQ